MKRHLERACQEALRTSFGVNGYRPGQKAAASCLLSGRDLLCILPTGAGKSLCWQLPAVVHEGLTVVISPLIALMLDQADGLRRRGIPCEAVTSLMSPQERREALQRLRSGESRILFIAPERLETEVFRSLCRDCPPWLVVVDEAHCVVEWGEDFRPVYARIGDFVRRLPERPVLCAMTATADGRMQRQILRSLGMAFHKRVMLPVLRENLIYEVRTTARPVLTILQLMVKEPVKTVVFCRTRARTEALAAQLRHAGLAAAHYHAGLDRQSRMDAQERFRSGDTLILAATTAFGMGVDIPDVRRVIHDSLPGSITELVQQSGRAGRDGQTAHCVILISPGDLINTSGLYGSLRGVAFLRPWLHWSFWRRHWRPMHQLLQVLTTRGCITAGISAAFGQLTPPCGRCSACLRGPLSDHAPDLSRADEKQIRLWLMQMQRDALARRRGCAPQSLITDAQLRHAARELQLPPLKDGEVSEAMERLIRSFRSGY